MEMQKHNHQDCLMVPLDLTKMLAVMVLSWIPFHNASLLIWFQVFDLFSVFAFFFFWLVLEKLELFFWLYKKKR